MSAEPAVLVLHDGELDHLVAVLEDLGADVQQRRGPLPDDLADPRELLITSWARAQDLGERCLGSDRPTWICVHSEDVAPLRDRMRELGVQYLVHRRLEGEALRLLLLQLLYQGPERRAEPRVPVGCDLIWSVACERRRGVLAELSSKTALLEPAKGRGGVKTVVTIYPNGSGL